MFTQKSSKLELKSRYRKSLFFIPNPNLTSKCRIKHHKHPKQPINHELSQNIFSIHSYTLSTCTSSPSLHPSSSSEFTIITPKRCFYPSQKDDKIFWTTSKHHRNDYPKPSKTPKMGVFSIKLNPTMRPKSVNGLRKN
jgi:hypothetical protein